MKSLSIKNQHLKKTLLATGLVAVMAIASVSHAGDKKDQDKRMYIDPVTGESKEAVKLLSEMTDTEKALLSNEEYRALKELETRLEQEAKQKASGE